MGESIACLARSRECRGGPGEVRCASSGCTRRKCSRRRWLSNRARSAMTLSNPVWKPAVGLSIGVGRRTSMSRSNSFPITNARSSHLASPAGGAVSLADGIFRRICAREVPNTPNIRQIRKGYTEALRQADAELVLNVARALLTRGEHRWVAYELVHHHRAAMHRIGEPELEEFGRGIDSRWTVDAFSLELSGPAWRERQVEDGLIECWARSPDRWWRRVALVSTVALNARACGGRGDVPRTLFVCRILVKDADNMVAKALSWALRELIPYERQAVQSFLDSNREAIPRRVLREVMNKLSLGLKNPRRTTPKVVRPRG